MPTTPPKWQSLIVVANGFFLLSLLVSLSVAAAHLARSVYRNAKTVSLPESTSILRKYIYATFLKPHTSETGQQAALESFYKSQADIYDATRQFLLRGREDMLGLVAAQLKYKQEKKNLHKKPVWLDLGGGTGYNIEAMGAFLDVPNFFAKVILVDLSPSLLDMAKKRFERLGWEVEVVCQDARSFNMEHHLPEGKGEGQSRRHADLITMSYSLSMIPDYYNILDHATSLLSPTGLIGVADFYVQSIVELQGRNYVGGSFNRHVTWLGRIFWRAWFDLDRVGLEGARRDYLEYKFGTLKTMDQRNYWLGGIPYYSQSGIGSIIVSNMLQYSWGCNAIFTLQYIAASNILIRLLNLWTHHARSLLRLHHLC